MPKKYIGEKYATSVEGAWDNARAYERLSICTYDNKAYISRQNVPAGTPLTNTNYWVLLFATGGSPGSIEWGDILDKPDFFPPSFHEQDWTTILNPPADYPPSYHTHPIEQVNGLSVTLSEMQTTIDTLRAAGAEKAIRYSQLGVLTDNVNSTITIPWDGIEQKNSTANPAWVNESGLIHLNNPTAENYDTYASGMVTMSAIGASRTFERILTITNFLGQDAAQFRLVPGDGEPPFVFVIPQFFVQTTITLPFFQMSARIKLFAGDRVGGNVAENYLALRAAKNIPF